MFPSELLPCEHGLLCWHKCCPAGQLDWCRLGLGIAHSGYFFMCTYLFILCQYVLHLYPAAVPCRIVLCSCFSCLVLLQILRLHHTRNFASVFTDSRSEMRISCIDNDIVPCRRTYCSRCYEGSCCILHMAG